MKNNRTIEQDIIQFIKKKELILPEQKILIGLSGGADSIFALHFFSKFKNKFNIQVAAIHVNHNLRGEESNKDADFCESYCKSKNTEYYSSDVKVITFAKQNKYSLEEAARILRYKEFEKFVKKSNSDLIVTAHNSSDNTETVLLNIVNGTGIKGISGIPVKRDKIIRPFLSVSKSEILNYLKKNNIDFIEDSSNEDVDFDRNYLRKEIIPLLKEKLNPSIDSVIFNTSQVLKDQGNALDFFIKRITGQIIKIDEDVISIELKEITKFPDFVFGEFFKNILKENFNLEHNFKQVEKLKTILKLQVGNFVELGEKVIAFKERDKISIFRDLKIPFKETLIEIGKELKIGNRLFHSTIVDDLPDSFYTKKNQEYISGDRIKDKLIIRPWKFGDRIQLLGMKGTKKISDVLTDLKISSSKRKNQLVLVNNNEIVWVIGHKISDKYKITSKTKRIIKLCLS